MAHMLYYPQRPLVSNRMSEIIGEELPIGESAIVAVYVTIYTVIYM